MKTTTIQPKINRFINRITGERYYVPEPRLLDHSKNTVVIEGVDFAEVISEASGRKQLIRKDALDRI